VEGGGRDAGDIIDGGLLGARVGVPTRGWWWPAAARSSPAYGRHVADAGWDEAGVRAQERGGGWEAGQAAVWAEREAGLARQRPPLFHFF